MPIYEYECQACGHRHEQLQKLSDEPLLECPACHQPQLKKLISAAGFQLKGSGWYVTDFKNSGKKPADKGKADAASTKPASDSTPASGSGGGGDKA